eukprot:COSAG06_NODE_4090_length_4585_cov_2.219795_4_plen_53_part_00
MDHLNPHLQYLFRGKVNGILRLSSRTSLPRRRREPARGGRACETVSRGLQRK